MAPISRLRAALRHSLSYEHVREGGDIWDVVTVGPFSFSVDRDDKAFWSISDPLNVKLKFSLYLYPWAYQAWFGARKTRLYKDGESLGNGGKS